MSADIGAKIGIDGEKQFRDSLRAINSEIKALNSEMKNVVTSFEGMDQGEESLAARTKVVNEALDVHEKKLGLLRTEFANSQKQLSDLGDALTKAKNEFGENSVEAGKAQNAYNRQAAETQRLKGQISETEAAMNKLNKELRDCEQASEKSGKGLANIAAKAKMAAPLIAAAGVAAGAMLVKLGKESVSAYADYEQLVGGIDTLFKENSQILQDYAANAYKTAGLSTNDYMETVTSFSASLISSLGGDTKKAVEYADRAITDMSDNANKIGTDITSIQNAYQGFAKQNYTMLDNLKLGYGGTKEEMERLLRDAESLSGLEFDISSFADITEAIHIVQESMGIAGTTASEAEETISGSVNAAKGAIENWLVGLADSNADVERLTQEMIEAFALVLKNVAPILENLVKAVGVAGKTMVKAFLDIGKDIVAGLWDGVKSKSSWLKGQITGWCQGIIGEVKGFFGIHSPSTLMADEVGANLALGVPVGFKRLMPQVDRDIANALKENSSYLEQNTRLSESSLLEGAVNALSTLNNRPISLTAQIVLPSGTVLAEVVFDDLLKISKQRGVSLGTT